MTKQEIKSPYGDANRYKYKVRLYFDYEMDDWGEEPDRHYAKWEAIHKLEEEVGSCYTLDEVFAVLFEVLKARVKVKLIKGIEEDDND